MARHAATSHVTARRVAGVGALALLLVGGVLIVQALTPGPEAASDDDTAASSAPSGSARSGCAEAAALRIVAASGIAPVIEALTDGGCAEVTVSVSDDPTAVAGLASGEVDVWVPDSSVRAVLAGRETASQAVSLARSPVVMATHRKLDTSAFAPGGATSWGLLLQRGPSQPVAFEIADPAASSTSLVVAAALRDIAVGATGDKYLGLAATASAMTDLPVVTTNAVKRGVVRMTEARLLPESPQATILATAEGNPHLDYPWVASPAIAGTPAGDAAAELLGRIQSSEGSELRQRHGLLDPDATDFDLRGDGSVTSPVIAVPGRREIPSLYALAESGGLRGNSLAVLDVSGSMAVAAGPGRPTPMDGVKSSAALATQFLSDETSLGLWQFGYQLEPPKDYVELVALRPLSKNRGQLQSAIADAEPLDTGTSLHRTILEADRYLRANWKADHSNLVVVFTDGKNEDAPGGLSLRQLLTRLDAERDPERPVQMILFGYGEADTKALKTIAKRSGGLTYQIDRPEQIVGAFIDSIAQSVLASLE